MLKAKKKTFVLGLNNGEIVTKQFPAFFTEERLTGATITHEKIIEDDAGEPTRAEFIRVCVLSAKEIEADPMSLTSCACPGCGYIITLLQKTLARYDYKCPRCKTHGIKSFK